MKRLVMKFGGTSVATLEKNEASMSVNLAQKRTIR